MLRQLNSLLITMIEIGEDIMHTNWSDSSGNTTTATSRALPELLIGSLILSMIIVTASFGNIMVIYSVFSYRPLRRVQNFFIVSLACSDLAVAILVMPFHIVKFVASRWCFGLVMCQLWLTLDILLCTASILNLCAISLDRYWAIHDPLKYANRRSKRLVLIMITSVWIAGLMVSAPPLLGWNDWSQDGLADTCVYTTQKGFVVFSSCCSFYIPLIIMTTVYIKIFIVARRRLRRQNVTVKKGLYIVEKSMREPFEHPRRIDDHDVDEALLRDTDESIEREQTEGNAPRRLLLVPYPDGIQRSNSRPSLRSNRSNHSSTSRDSRRSFFSRNVFCRSPSCSLRDEPEIVTETDNPGMTAFFREKEKISLSRERRAAKTLAVIMGGFVLCWLPFFTLYLLEPFLESRIIHPKVFEASNWLGYINSSLNPVIYTIFNMDFRMAFQRIVCKQKTRNKYRSVISMK